MKNHQINVSFVGARYSLCISENRLKKYKALALKFHAFKNFAHNFSNRFFTFKFFGRFHNSGQVYGNNAKFSISLHFLI